MVTFTLKASAHSPMTFHMPLRGGAVCLETGNQAGTLSTQICEGGKFYGPKVHATPPTFEQACIEWYSSFLTNSDLGD